jgi:transforming growth factor-beta-induced protein
MFNKKSLFSVSILLVLALLIVACAPAVAPEPTPVPTEEPAVMEPEPEVEPEPELQTIVDIAVADGRFTTLVAALQAADLVGALSGDGPFTVFAPTDDAFGLLPEGTVEALLGGYPHPVQYPALPCCFWCSAGRRCGYARISRDPVG